MNQEMIESMSIRDSSFFYKRGLDNWSPRDIENWIHTDGGIIGQDAAVRAAAMIVYNHYEGRPSVSLFAGPTGSGKTQIWRALQQEYGSQNIIIQDASVLSAEGWRGGNKISTIFRSLNADQRERIILVLDECDKLLEPMYGANGTNYSDLMQNQLLRMCDHDTLFFGSEDSQSSMTISCARVSVVMLGAFARLTEQKKKDSSCIGFGRNPEFSQNSVIELTTEDLIDYGMRAELAGRLDRIVCMDPLSIQDLVQIGKQEVTRLEEQLHIRLRIAPDVLIMLARAAVGKGLGARWLKARLGQLLDDRLYDDPDADSYEILYESADADARRQACCMD